MARRQSKKTRTQTSVEMVFSNDDLMFKILQLLPITVLLSLKTVSKQWHSVIERCRQTAPLGLFLYKPFSNKYELLSILYDGISITNLKSLDMSIFQSGIRILHSCYGLLCCSTKNPFEFTAEFFIYNPTTRQSAPLPKRGQCTSISSVICGLTLAYDPSISPCYKVVFVKSKSISSKQYWVEVYSPETGWCAYCEPFTPTGVPRFMSGVYWNGAVHWISEKGDSFYFDIAHGKVRIMPMPPNQREIRNIRYFGESKGRLFLVDKNELDRLNLEVYELKEDYTKWYVRYQVDLTFIASVYPHIISNDMLGRYRVAILAVVRGETEEKSFLILHFKGIILRCMFNDKNYKVIRRCHHSLRFSAHPYFESLAGI